MDEELDLFTTTPTPAENAAFVRLRKGDDYDTLIAYMLRCSRAAVADIVKAPHQNQATDLLLAQGGYQLIKKVVNRVSEAITPVRQTK